MPRPPFWVFTLAGLISFFFFFLLSSLDWMNFWGYFSLLVFLSLMIFSHFDALSRLLSCFDALAPFYAWWIFPFLMKSLLDESCIPHGMMNFRFFKLDAHFAFSHIDRISWSLISTHLSYLLGELYQLASKLQGRLLLNMRFEHAYFKFSHPRFRF